MQVKQIQVRAETFLQQLPIPVCGLTLGLSALGNLLPKETVLLRWIYFGAALTFLGLLFLKLVRYWGQAWEELQHPLTCSVFEAVFMTLLQFSAALAESAPRMAFFLWVLANCGHMGLVCYFSWRFLPNYQLENVYTTWNVLYGGNMLAAVLAPLFSMEQAGILIFWIGFFLFLPWYPVSCYRYWKLPVAESVRPTICILAAPFHLTVAGYLSCGLQPDWRFAVAFAVLGQLMYGFVLLHLPSILRLPFYPSYGALTFPFVIPVVALQKLMAFLPQAAVQVPIWLPKLIFVERCIAIVMVTYALVRYLQYFWEKR